jgi:hypothetical protein
MSYSTGKHMIKHFNKLIETNKNIQYAISTIIAEYDIASAHTTACYFIYGEELYKELAAMPKLDRNIRIGKMMSSDPVLHEKINTLLLKWFNLFCEENNIKENNVISSTRDSILLVNKKPLKTVFENGLVTFRNKEGEYTSYLRLQNHFEVLYDAMSGSLRIKGIPSSHLENHPFIKIFKQALSVLEQSNSITISAGLKKLSKIRNNYIYAANADMYRSLLDGNKFVYYINGERILSDGIIENEQLIKQDNYVNFLLPIINIYFIPK